MDCDGNGVGGGFPNPEGMNAKCVGTLSLPVLLPGPSHCPTPENGQRRTHANMNYADMGACSRTPPPGVFISKWRFSLPASCWCIEVAKFRTVKNQAQINAFQ